MKTFKRVALCGALFSGLIYGITAYAYPMPGETQEVYVTYYSNAARTNVVGVRGISHGSACDVWHATWGTTTSYSTVTVANCDTIYD